MINMGQRVHGGTGPGMVLVDCTGASVSAASRPGEVPPEKWALCLEPKCRPAPRLPLPAAGIPNTPVCGILNPANAKTATLIWTPDHVQHGVFSGCSKNASFRVSRGQDSGFIERNYPKLNFLSHITLIYSEAPRSAGENRVAIVVLLAGTEKLLLIMARQVVRTALHCRTQVRKTGRCGVHLQYVWS